MHVVTVTCNRDFNQMVLQAESINKFLNPPCHHYVIINESDVDLNFWQEQLNPFYTNHKLHLMSRIEYDYEKSGIIFYNSIETGWKIQQLQKLLIGYLINDDYVILDSKDFFISNTDINEWDKTIGNTISHENEPNIFDDSSKAYADYFKVEKKTRIFHQYTPYVIRKKYITENKNFDFFTIGEALWAPDSRGLHLSEFVFYSYLIPEEHDVWKKPEGPLPPPTPTSQKFFSLGDYDWSSSKFIKDLVSSYQRPEIKLLSIHNRILSELDEKTLDFTNQLLHHVYDLNTKLSTTPIEYNI